MDLYGHNLKLVTFHHVLHDQLMPWLPEQQSLAFYKAWEQYVHKHKGPYLMRLLEVYARNKRKLSPELKAEWEAVSWVRLKPEILEFIRQLQEQRLSDLKLFFYRDLLVYAFGCSLSYFEDYVGGLSEERKQFVLRNLMRQLDDLYASSIVLFRTSDSVDVVVVYLVHLFVVLFRERLVVRYHKILFKGTVLLSKDLLRPDSLQDYPMYRVMNSLYEDYFREFRVLLLPKQKPKAEEMLQDDTLEAYANHLQAQRDVIAEPPLSSIAEKDTGGQTKNTPEDRNEAHSMKPLLSTAEAAKLLGISENGMRKKAIRMEIPPVKIGRLYKFEPDAIEAYIKSKGLKYGTGRV